MTHTESLESIYLEFKTFQEEARETLENLQLNIYEPSFERSATPYYENEAEYDADRDIAHKAIHGVRKTAVGLYRLTRKVLEKVALLIHKTAKFFKHFIASGYPIIKKRLLFIDKLLKNIEHYNQKNTEVELKNAAKYLTIDNQIVDIDEIEKHLEYLKDVTTVVLGRSKLEFFDDYTSRILQPFEATVKQKKTDEIVFILGVLAALTNPAVIVGEVLKKLSIVVAPNASKAIDVGTTLAGLGLSSTIIESMKALVPTLGSHATSMMRDMSNGKINLSSLPKYKEYFNFCEREIKGEQYSIFKTFASNEMLGGRLWKVTDYQDSLDANLKGSVSKVGAYFTRVKTKEKAENKQLKPLDKDEVAMVLRYCQEILKLAEFYCRTVNEHIHIYEKQYTKINEIVNGFEDKRLRGTYVKHAYKTAMNQILGNLWTNSFGSDLKYLHYLIGCTGVLVKYCEQSLFAPVEEDENDEETNREHHEENDESPKDNHESDDVQRDDEEHQENQDEDKQENK